MWSSVAKAGNVLKRLDAVPITPREFYGSHAQAIWKPNAARHSTDSDALQIGLCVSGGADSMCLAYLFKQLHEQDLSPPLDLKAFIIDHQARHGSTAEARGVARWLSQIGVKSEILTMQWPETVLPGSLPNFETQARLKRYRLLADAATRSGIRQLVLGHHEDDQIETILMRLVRGKSGSMASFWGMGAEAPIPTNAEAASELVSFQTPAIGKCLAHSNGTPNLRQAAEDCGSNWAHSTVVKSLAGRIAVAPALDLRLHRPLLKFSKARILATCNANGIPFVSDLTNFDPQITVRNAIRYLLAKYRLPRALRRESVLEIHGRAIDRLNSVNGEVQRFWDVAQVTSLDLRSGCLTMMLPKFLSFLEPEYSETPVSFLAQILRLVSPMDTYEMSKASQRSAARLVFTDVPSALDRRSVSASVPTVAVNQVLMTQEVPEHATNQPYSVAWQLSRQPFKREQIQRMSRTFVHQPTPGRGGAAEVWSEWIFWDCRYWIRICCTSICYLQTCSVRPFQASDGAALRSNLEPESRETIANRLHDAAPGKVRYTLPVITDQAGVRAFPTLDFAVPEHGRDGVRNKKNRSRLLAWQVKYKYIDRETIDRLVGHTSSTDQYGAAIERRLDDQS